MIGMRRNGIALESMHIPNRKKPALCIVENGCATVIGFFRDDESAEDFWETLDYIMNGGKYPRRTHNE